MIAFRFEVKNFEYPKLSGLLIVWLMITRLDGCDDGWLALEDGRGAFSARLDF